MEMQISKENPLIRKRFLHSLVVIFDMCEKQLMWIIVDGNMFGE